MPNVTRRQVIQTAGVAATAVVLSRATATVQAAQGGASHVLPKLPYAYDALAPHIDERTMRIHHTLHHQTYVTNLNTALMNHPELSKLPLEQLLTDIKKVPQDIRQRVINNGGGHYNHTLFWQMMQPKGHGHPHGALAKAITATFTSFNNFKNQFKQAALDRFGSGWAWLVKNNNRLEITSTANQDPPILEGKQPLLGIDVWEHAYYLNYQNRRAEYIDAWWNVVNWDYVQDRFARK